MKNALLVLITLVAIVATMNSFGIVNVFPKITRSGSETLESGAPLAGTCIPDEAINAEKVKDLYKLGSDFIAASGIKLKREYYLNPYTIQHLLEKSNGRGIMITPTINKDGIMIIAYPSTAITCDNTNDVTTDYGYVIKTFCPEICESVY